MRSKGIALALVSAFVLLALVPFADSAEADGEEADYTFYRYTIKYFSTSQDEEYLIWDFADGTVLDGRWEYYAQLEYNGGELTAEQSAGLAAYREMLAQHGGVLKNPIHTYAEAGIYTYSITAINPIGFVGSNGMPYDGVFSQDQDGFDGGLSAGITRETYNPDDKSVSGSWDTAFVTLDVRGFPTVSFESNGGSDVPQITVENTDVYAPAAKPADPTKEGYDFAGWYSDPELDAAYDWSAPVEVPITLYAKWDVHTVPVTEITVTVDGKELTVSAGKTVGDLAVPSKEGYTFSGWFADAACTHPLSKDTVLTEGMHAYAGFAENADTEKVTDWTPVLVIIAGIIVALIGIRYHPAIIIAGAAVAAVGGLDFAGIVDIFGGLL